MNFDEIQNLIKKFVDEPYVEFQIEREDLLKDNGLEKYNQTIRNNVEEKHGVYIWLNP